MAEFGGAPHDEWEKSKLSSRRGGSGRRSNAKATALDYARSLFVHVRISSGVAPPKPKMR